MTAAMMTREQVRELGLDRSIVRGCVTLFGPTEWLDALIMGAPEDWADWICWTSRSPWDMRRYAVEPTFLSWRDDDGTWTAEWEWLGATYNIQVTGGTRKQLTALVREAYARQRHEWEETL